MDLEQQYSLALDTARKSECVRRKYGVVIDYATVAAGQNPLLVHGYNKRIGRCCDGELCARDRFRTRNGERVELGAEIHAEQAALIKWVGAASNRFVLAGLDAKGKELTGTITFPCHVCSLMIADAGFKHVYLKLEKNRIEAVSIWDIIEHREREWEYEYDV